MKIGTQINTWNSYSETKAWPQKRPNDSTVPPYVIVSYAWHIVSCTHTKHNLPRKPEVRQNSSVTALFTIRNTLCQFFAIQFPFERGLIIEMLM